MEVRPAKALDSALKGVHDTHMCSQEERLANLKISLGLASEHDQRMAIMNDIYLIHLQRGDYESIVEWTGAIIELVSVYSTDSLMIVGLPSVLHVARRHLDCPQQSWTAPL